MSKKIREEETQENTTIDDSELVDEKESRRRKKLKKKPKPSSNEDYVEYYRSERPNPVYYPPPPPQSYYPHGYGYYNGPPMDYHHSAKGVYPPTSSSPPQYSGSEDYSYEQSNGKFYFKPRRETLNWRILLQLDIEKIMDKVDIDTIESVTKNLTFSRVDYNDLRYFNETNFVQVFRLSQLIIEYLLYVQNYLSSKKKDIESNVKTLIQDLEDAKANLVKKTEENNYLKKELKRKKKSLYAFECVFGTNSEKARIMMMSQQQQTPQTNTESGAFKDSNRSDKDETFGEIRGEIKRMQENLFTKLESTIERNQESIEKETKRKLDQFQKEFERFTENSKAQQENLYSHLQQSVKSFAGGAGFEEVGATSEDFLKFSSQIQNLIQQNNQLLMTSFERKLQDITASTKQIKELDTSKEVSDMKRKLDDFMKGIENRPVEVRQVLVQSAPPETPKEEISTMIKAKSRFSVKGDQKVEGKSEPVKVDPEPPKEQKPDPVKVEPPKVKHEPVISVKPKETIKPEPKVEQQPEAKAERKVEVKVEPKPEPKEVKVESKPEPKVEPVEVHKIAVPEPVVDEHEESYLTTSSEYTTDVSDSTVSTDVSKLGLRERIYRDIDLSQVMDDFDPSNQYEVDEDKPWLTSKFRQNPEFIEMQRRETKNLLDLDLQKRGITREQTYLSEQDYSAGLKKLQRDRDLTVKNNPDHMVVMNDIRFQVDKLANERLQNQTDYDMDSNIKNMMAAMAKLDEYFESRKQAKKTPKTPTSPKSPRTPRTPRTVRISSPPEQDTPTIKIPKPTPSKQPSQQTMQQLVQQLMQEAVKKKEELKHVTTEQTKEQSAESKQSQLTVPKEPKHVKKPESEEKSLNNTQIIEPHFDDVLVAEDNQGSTVFENVGESDSEETEYETEMSETSKLGNSQPIDLQNTTESSANIDESGLNSTLKDTIQPFTAVEDPSELSENISKPVQVVARKPSVKQIETDSDDSEEESAVQQVVNKVLKVKAVSDDDEDSDDDLPTKHTLSNAALGNKFKSLNNMWDGMNKKKPSVKIDTSAELPDTDEFDVSSSKITPKRSNSQRTPTRYSSDISGFINALKDEDDLDVEEL